MRAQWTISLNGQSAVSLVSMGISNPRVTKQSAAMGALSFTMPVSDANISAPRPFSFGDKLQLYRDAECFFVGRVREQALSFGGGKAIWQVVAFDAWWELDRTVYRQAATGWIGGNPPTQKVGVLGSRIALHGNAYGAKLTQFQQVQQIMIFAASKNPGNIGSIQIPSGSAAWPAEEARDITCGEALRRVYSVEPSQIPYPVYSTGIFQQRYAQRSALTNVVLDLSAANLVTGVNSMMREDENVPPGVVFDFFQTVAAANGDSLSKLTRQVAGVPGAAGTIYTTINLGTCDAVPTGAAQLYFQSVNVPQWSGQLSLAEEECSGMIAPGCRVNMTNGNAEWATMNAIVHRCDYDIELGRTTVELGPPPQIGAEDFITMLSRWRNRLVPSGFCSVKDNGQAGNGTGYGDGDTLEAPPANQPDPANPDAGGNGVSGGATSSTGPGTNPNAGGPGFGVLIADQSRTAELTLCDGSTLSVLIAQ